MHQLEHPQLQMEPLLLAIAKFVESAQHDLQEARQVFLRKLAGNAGHARTLVGGNLQ